MSNYKSNNRSRLRSGLVPKSEADALRLPEQVADYIANADTRFSEVAHLYLDGLTIRDLQFMQPEDLINIVPPPQHNHKLLMSILVRRYLFRDEDDDGENDLVQYTGDVIDASPRRKHNRKHYHKHDEASDYCRCRDCMSNMSDY
jgi:hypothetical protein